MEQTSLFSQVALGFFIPVSIGLFFLMRPQVAALITIVGGDMFLPELTHFRLPLVPGLDKHNLPYLCVLVACLMRQSSRVTRPPKERWFLWATLALLLGAAMTGLTNGDWIDRKWFSPLPGITLKDGLYMAALNMGYVSLPFFLGWSLFRTARDFRTLLTGLVIAGLVYMPFALLEIRVSPQLHTWLYGFSQHPAFDQTMRWGGYRPMAFMSHGLSLARFFMVAMLSAFILGRCRYLVFGMSANMFGWALLVMLILCKSTGAILFAAVGVPLLLWGHTKIHLRIAMVLSVFVLLYPTLRADGLIPTDSILDFLNWLVGKDRSSSLEFRFTNENALLEKARQRLIFGWGEYGRNFVYEHWGPVAVADGYWVLQIGVLGIVGFISTFLPMLIPPFLTRKRLKFIESEIDRKMVAGVALMLALIALDWIPNGLWAPYPYMISGALAGVTRELAFNRSPASTPVAEWT